jgi:hypothetical protein
LFPVSFSKDFEKSAYAPEVKWWRAVPLIQSMQFPAEFSPEIERVVFKKAGKIVFLNCLDTCYGHVFQKLLHAQAHLDDLDFGLLVIIPEGFQWMVPEGIAELWVVKAPLSDLHQRITGFDALVKGEFARFEEVKWSKAPIQPDASKINWPLFLKQSRFDLAQFQKLPCLVTFVWREDRFWHNTALEEILFLASKKFKVFDLVKWYFVWRQMGLFAKAAKQIKKRMGKAEFALVGLGHSGKAHLIFVDHRIPGKISHGKETEWFPVLAKSHVIIGILGSSMLIPTALAASFVDIVPHRMLALLGEDIAQPYSDRRLQFLGRFVHGTPSAKQVTRQVLGILQGFAQYSQLLPKS